MKWKNIVPWLGNQETTPIQRTSSDPFTRFQTDMERVMGNFFTNLPSLFSETSSFGSLQGFSPNINVEESEREIRVTAELPGMEQKDIDIQLTPEAVVIRGEKKLERREEKDGRSYFESSFGSFQRAIPLNCEIDEDAVKAELKNGVLHLNLAKRAGSENRVRKIKVA